MSLGKIKNRGIRATAKEELLDVAVFVPKKNIEVGETRVCLRDSIFCGKITAFRVEKDDDGEEKVKYTVEDSCGETIKVSYKQLFFSEESAFKHVAAKILGAVCNAARYFGETREIDDREVLLFDVKNERIYDRDDYVRLSR